MSEDEGGGGIGRVLKDQVGMKDAEGVRHPRIGADGEDGEGRGEGGCQS